MDSQPLDIAAIVALQKEVSHLQSQLNKQYTALLKSLKPAILKGMASQGKINQEDAEEIFWDICRSITDNLQQFDPKKGSINGWAYTIAKHRVIDYLRKPRPPTPQQFETSTEAHNQAATDSANPLLRVIAQEGEEDLVEALLATPLSDGKLLWLIYVLFDKNVSQAQLAKIFSRVTGSEVTEKAVSQKIIYARQLVKKYLTQKNSSEK